MVNSTAPSQQYDEIVILANCFTTDNGVVAKVFLELTDEDIEDKQLNISFGGKKILKKLIKQLKKRDVTEKSDS